MPTTAPRADRQGQPDEFQAPDNAAHLDRSIKATVEKALFIKDYFDRNPQKVEDVLPGALRGQGARLSKRALLYFNKKPDLRDCPREDFIRCVIEAAEVGLAIDGKLCHVVRYKGTWQVQTDYKGLIVVARRSGQIRDAYADVVCEKDRFVARRVGQESFLEHELPPLGSARGEVIGAYAVLKLPQSDWRYELMDRADLDRIQRRAASQKGPWATDTNEMRKKTVIRRGLKLYCDDPAVGMALAMAGDDDDDLLDAGVRASAAAAADPTARLEERLRGAGAPPAANHARTLRHLAETARQMNLDDQAVGAYLSDYDATKLEDLDPEQAESLLRKLEARVLTAAAEREPGQEG